MLLFLGGQQTVFTAGSERRPAEPRQDSLRPSSCASGGVAAAGRPSDLLAALDLHVFTVRARDEAVII